MIYQVNSADLAPGGLAWDGGSAYSVRVVQFSAGATIAFDTPKSTRKILGYFAYRNSKPGGWLRLYLTGSAIIEVASSPDETFGGSGVAGVSAIDGNQNTIIVGPDAPAAAPTGNPVLLAGRDDTPLVRVVKVDANGRPILGNPNRRTFTAGSSGGVLPTGNWALVVGAGNAGNTIIRVKRIILQNPGLQTTAGVRTFQLQYVTTLPTAGNNSGTILEHDPNNEAVGGMGFRPRQDLVANLTTMVLGNVVAVFPYAVPNTLADFVPRILADWTNEMDKAPRADFAGTVKGYALVDVNGAAGASGLHVYIELTEESV